MEDSNRRWMNWSREQTESMLKKKQAALMSEVAFNDMLLKYIRNDDETEEE